MVRGSIEVAQRSRVAGWIYASSDSLRDRMILAFVNGRCIGSGKVEKFRRDLLDAKLGDGYCGFDFPIRLQDDEKLGAVIVKLQDADAALIQRASRITGPEDEGDDGKTDLGAMPPGAVSWMQDRGWLEQHEFDFIKAVQSVGAYERGLRQTRRPGAEAGPPNKPEMVVRDLAGLYSLCDVDVRRTHVASLSDLADTNSMLRQAPVSVVGLWSEDRCRVSVEERSHAAPAGDRGQLLAEAPAGGIDYCFGPDRLLFLHRDCNFAPQGSAPTGGVVIFTASIKAFAVMRRVRAA